VVGKKWGVMKMVGNVGVRVYSGRQEYCTQYSVLNVGYDRDGTIVEFTLLVPVVNRDFQ
nr:hypothetical protein [Tanacetum cinerariifolium]